MIFFTFYPSMQHMFLFMGNSCNFTDNKMNFKSTKKIWISKNASLETQSS